MNKSKKPFLIAVTGGIASGKSLVCRWFEQQDIPVYYADKIGHNILNDPDMQSAVTGIFGNAILENGKVNRKRLGKLAFNDPNKLSKLNEILHPGIIGEMQRIVDDSQEDILIFEIPLLFEKKMEKDFDLVLNVSSRTETRLERIIERDQISRSKAQQKIASQMPDKEKQEKADFNIFNDSDLEKLYAQLREFRNTIIVAHSKRKYERYLESGIIIKPTVSKDKISKK